MFKIREQIKNSESQLSLNSKNIISQSSNAFNERKNKLSNSNISDSKKIKLLDDLTDRKIHPALKIQNSESFDENLIQANMSYDIQTVGKIETSKPKVIRNLVLKFRNIIQNEIRFALNPIVNKQIKFNIHIVKSVTGLKKILDKIELKQQLRTDKIELKQQLRTDEIERNSKINTQSIDLTLLYLASLFYLKREPTFEEINQRFPDLLPDQIKKLEIFSAFRTSTESLVHMKKFFGSSDIDLIDSEIASKNVDGHIVNFYHNDRTYLEPFTNDRLYEPNETILLKKLLKKDMNVINIGANIGYFTLLAARQIGSHGKVFAFEPFPKAVDLLRKNIDANGYSNVEVIPMAVSNKVGTSRLALKSDTAHNFISETTLEYETIDVPITTIDEYTKSQKIDFIIMDAEGYEPLILDGMSQTLAKNPQIQIITEFNPYTLEVAGNSGEKFVKKIEQLGFTISIINSELTSNAAIKEKLLKIKYPNTATLHLTKS